MYGWTPDFVVHELPLAQLFALNACHAWGQGLEVVDANFEDLDLLDELARNMAAEA